MMRDGLFDGAFEPVEGATGTKSERVVLPWRRHTSLHIVEANLGDFGRGHAVGTRQQARQGQQKQGGFHRPTV